MILGQPRHDHQLVNQFYRVLVIDVVHNHPWWPHLNQFAVPSWQLKAAGLYRAENWVDRDGDRLTAWEEGTWYIREQAKNQFHLVFTLLAGAIQDEAGVWHPFVPDVYWLEVSFIADSIEDEAMLISAGSRTYEVGSMEALEARWKAAAAEP